MRKKEKKEKEEKEKSCDKDASIIIIMSGAKVTRLIAHFPYSIYELEEN